MRLCRLRWLLPVAGAAALALSGAASPAARASAPQPADPGGAPGAAVPVAAPSAAEILAYWSVQSAGEEAASLSDLARHASAVTWLSPYWFTLNGNATLTSHEPDHAAVLAGAGKVNVPVLALVSEGAGLAGLLSTAAGRSRAVAAVSAMLQNNAGIRGVVVDFELLPVGSRDALTAFITLLKNTLPVGDPLGVAVMPKSSNPGTYSWQRVFDYSAIGAVADFVQIMTYDHHGPGSLPGPISPNDWVARVAAFAATQIPARKLLIGVPGYGYNWSGGTNAVTVTVMQALWLAARHGVTPTFDPVSGEMHFTYRTLAGARHTVWYESAAGVAQKYQMVRKLGLGGLALWTIGGEQPAFWPAAEGTG